MKEELIDLSTDIESTILKLYKYGLNHLSDNKILIDKIIELKKMSSKLTEDFTKIKGN